MVRTRSRATRDARDDGERQPARRRHSRAGYVLIEAVATFTIVMLILAFALPTISPGTTPTRLLALVSASASLLRDARTAAIETDRSVATRFDSSRRRLSAGSTVLTIPADVDFELTTGGNCPAGNGVAVILFRPDGSSCGGILRFGKGRRLLRTRVDWADGHVDVVEGG